MNASSANFGVNLRLKMWQIASPNGKFNVLLSQKQIDKLEKAILKMKGADLVNTKDNLPNMIQPSKLQNKPYL